MTIISASRTPIPAEAPGVSQPPSHAAAIAPMSSGDTEMLLQALHHWGPERALPKFDGMFAFAYSDRREGALWLARDRVGIKPLLAADIGAELIFASEAKALLAHPRMRAVQPASLERWNRRHPSIGTTGKKSGWCGQSERPFHRRASIQRKN